MNRGETKENPEAKRLDFIKTSTVPI
jgi:hypothetical protein